MVKAMSAQLLSLGVAVAAQQRRNAFLTKKLRWPTAACLWRSPTAYTPWIFFDLTRHGHRANKRNSSLCSYHVKICPSHVVPESERDVCLNSAARLSHAGQLPFSQLLKLWWRPWPGLSPSKNVHLSSASVIIAKVIVLSALQSVQSWLPGAPYRSLGVVSTCAALTGCDSTGLEPGPTVVDMVTTGFGPGGQ